ncbi:MAG: phage tail protein [Kiritimatiellia bacterium]
MSNNKRVIRGAGGDDDSAGTPRIPVEGSDTIQTRAFIRVVDLIGEGEIEGLVNGEESVYLDETPLKNPDGSYNFTGVTVIERKGTQDQSYIPGFGSVENEISLNVPLKHAEPVIREINGTNINRIKVRLELAGLQRTDVSSGDISGASVRFTLWIQPSGGSYAKAADRTVSGKSSSRFEVQLGAELTGDAPWNIKIVRETPESDSAYVVDDATVASYTQVIDSKLRYPNSALVAIRLNAEQFSSVPSRYFDMRGLKIRIPSNYDPETRIYTGDWDGTFQTAWSDNPAWCFFDICTSSRYGLGSFIAEGNIDKWGLYSIGKYCDELVPDGYGGFEPRFRCNLMLQSRQEAYTVLQNMASIFRSMIYWAAGLVTASQDAPSDAVALYTPANVVDGNFVYQGASARTRHNVALVAWNDPEDLYRQKVEYVEDRDSILQYGINETEIVAFGCTSRGQAHRLGKWLLYTEKNEAETVTFKAGLDALVCRPGQLIQVADPTRAGARMGGRIAAATTTQITVDAIPDGDLDGGRIYVMLPDGSFDHRLIEEISGNAVTVSEAFTAAPKIGATWMIRSLEVEPQTFRVITIKEDEGGVFEVTALASDPEKYALIEQGIDLPPRSYSSLRIAPPAPAGLVAEESLYRSGSTVKVKVSVGWQKVIGAVSYVLQYRRDNDNWVQFPETANISAELTDAQPGLYVFELIALNSLGVRSPTSSLSQEVFGKTSPPASVSGFSLLPVSGMARLNWNQSTDLDVLVGGYIEIRWTPAITGQAWGDAIRIDDGIPGNATSVQLPLLSGTYMAKFVDSSGNPSLEETIITTTVPEALALNVIDTITESPGFPGEKVDMVFDETEQAISLASRITFDEIPDLDLEGPIDAAGGVGIFGEYNFEETFDLGAVFTSNLTALVAVEAFDIGQIFDLRYDDMDSWEDLDGESVSDVAVELYVRSTEDDPEDDPEWSDWKRFVATEYRARAYQFKLTMLSPSPTHNAWVRSLSVVVDMDDRTVNGVGLASGLGSTYRFDYPEPFRVPPAVAITANNMASGDYYTISNESETGFDVVFKNAGDTIVSRNFNVVAKGYGRQVA